MGELYTTQIIFQISFQVGLDKIFRLKGISLNVGKETADCSN